MPRCSRGIRPAEAELDEERQTHEKTALELNLRLAALDEELKRVARKSELLDAERRRAEEEQTAVENRQREARESLVKLDGEKQKAEELLSVAQEELSKARTSFDTMGQSFADNKALHARLVERALAEKSAVNRIKRFIARSTPTRLGVQKAVGFLIL